METVWAGKVGSKFIGVRKTLGVWKSQQVVKPYGRSLFLRGDLRKDRSLI